MSSFNKSISAIFLSFIIVSFAGIADTSTSMIPFVQSVIAQEFDMFNISCIGINPCSGNEIDNSVTDNSVDNSDNSQDNDVTISDSYNPQYTNNCANTSGSQTQENTTNSTEEMSPRENTCTITDSSLSFTPSTLSLTSLD
jgi:hypothetical protein